MNANTSFIDNAKIRRMRRRNASLRANVRRNDLNALRRNVTRAHDAKTRVERHDAIREIEFALSSLLRDVI
jgi:hypothetical protein